MILDSITLYNYGLFKGEHKINFSQINKKRNVILIGGLNGAGKTTLLEAIQLGLYGRLSPEVQRSSVSYEKLLHEKINRQVVPEEGAFVEICFRVQEDGNSRTYSVHRSWSSSNCRAKESLAVSVDGNYDEILTSTWAEHTERFIPAHLASLFFFDGEKIEALADPERSKQAIQTAMEALLGLDIVSQLETDLTTLERRKVRSAGDTGTGSNSARVKELEEAYTRQRSLLQGLRQKEASLRNEADALEKQLQGVLKALAAKGGSSFESRKEIEERYASAKEELNANEQRLRDAANGALPLYFLLSKMQVIHKQAEKNAKLYQLTVTREFIKAYNDRLLEFIKKEPNATDNLRTAVTGFVEREFFNMFGKLDYENDIVRIEEEAISRIDFLIRQLPMEEREARRLLVEHDKLFQRECTLERALATIPEEDSIASILAEREKINSAVNEAKVRIRIVEEEIQQSTKQIENTKEQLERELKRCAEEIREHSQEARIIEHSRKAIQTLALFKKRLLAKHAKKLGELIQECFSHLLHKELLTSEIQVNPDNCSLVLFDNNRKELPPEILSAGERQLLAVSLLWGLARAAGRPLPVVVDTPLGRLDGTHRLNLVKRYFPEASHQVFILSTDEEIASTLFETLLPHVAHSYLLEYRDDLKHSVVNTGYFKQVEAAV